MKRYCDSVAGGAPLDYNALERRATSKGGSSFLKGGSAKASRPASARQAPSRAASSAHASSSGNAPARDNNQRSATESALNGAAQAAAVPPPRRRSRGSGEYRKQISDMSSSVAELKLTVESVEKERDFYFTKLRDVEILCQRPEHASTPLGIAVAQILYAMDEQSAQDVLDGKAPAEPEAHPVDVTATDAEAEEAKPDVAATEDDVPTSVTKMGLVRLDSSSSSFGKSPLVSGTPLAARSPLAGLENRAQASPMC